MSDVVLELPDALRSELKEPLGPIYTDAERLLSAATRPIVTVGDVVTYHLLEAGHVPALAFVDERTKRQAVGEEIREVIAGRRSDVGREAQSASRDDERPEVSRTTTPTSGDDRGESAGGFDQEVAVDNPPATLTAELLATLRDGLDQAGTTLVRVEGEEDLAALPAILAAPEGASVVYGQPDEGMVLVTVNDETREFVRGLIERMDGDSETAQELLA